MHDSRTRTFFGEETAAQLLRWLNSNTASASRIERLLEAAERRGRVAAPAARTGLRLQVIHGWTGKIAVDPRDVPVRGKSQEFREATEEINSILAEYKLTPKLWQSSFDQWNINWTPARRVSPASKAEGPFSPVTTEEAYALLKLLELAGQGLISRVKKCDCGIWFYLRFPHQRFHLKECQQHRFRSDPTWKAKRREYMKRLRALHKQISLATKDRRRRGGK